MVFKPKLVAFDLDGTLAESKQRVTAEMGELLGELLEMLPVAVMSGGSWKQFEAQLLPAIPAEAKFEQLFLFPTSAARCFIFKDDTWKSGYDFAFGTSEKAQIMQALKEAITETGFDHIPERKPEWGEQIEDRETQITYSALGQQAPVDVKKKWDPARQKRKPLHDALARKLPNFSVKLNATTSIDITKKGINKAFGIKKLVEMSGISVSEILYVGDALEEGGNDAVVIETGVKTHQVFGPEETAVLIGDLLKAHRATKA